MNGSPSEPEAASERPVATRGRPPAARPLTPAMSSIRPRRPLPDAPPVSDVERGRDVLRVERLVARRRQQRQHVGRARRECAPPSADSGRTGTRVSVADRETADRRRATTSPRRVGGQHDVAPDRRGCRATRNGKCGSTSREPRPREVAPLVTRRRRAARSRAASSVCETSTASGVVDAEREARDELLAAPIVVPIDGRPRVPSAPAAVQECSQRPRCAPVAGAPSAPAAARRPPAMGRHARPRPRTAPRGNGSAGRTRACRRRCR